MPDTVVAWANVPERLPAALIESIRDLADRLRAESDLEHEPDQEPDRLGAGDIGLGDRDESGG
jgi:hypothetical protein